MGIVINRIGLVAEQRCTVLKSDTQGAFTTTRVRIRVPVYGFQETRVCMYFNGGRSHWYEFCTFCTFTCEFHSYEQFLCRSCSYPTRTKWTTENLY